MDGVDRDEGMLLDAASTATRSAGDKLRSVFERHDKRGRGKITVEAFGEGGQRPKTAGTLPSEATGAPTPREPVASFQKRIARARAQLAHSRAVAKQVRAKRKTAASLIASAFEVEEWAIRFQQVGKVGWVTWFLRLALLIAPIITYSMCFEPCFQCYDFQAAATHEIGHVLGLHNPDKATWGGRNIEVMRTAGELRAIELASQTLLDASGRSTGASAVALVDEPALQECGGLHGCLASGRSTAATPGRRLRSGSPRICSCRA